MARDLGSVTLSHKQLGDCSPEVGEVYNMALKCKCTSVSEETVYDETSSPVLSSAKDSKVEEPKKEIRYRFDIVGVKEKSEDTTDKQDLPEFMDGWKGGDE